MSGFPEAQKAREVAIKELEALIVASVAEPATTMQGIMVKARAMQAYRTLEKYSPFCNIDARFRGADLADVLLSLPS